MIQAHQEAEILRLYHAEKWRIGTISTQLGVHHSTVRRVLRDSGLDAARHSLRPSMADPFLPFIHETLKKYPKLRASRLYEMVKQRGYPGAPDHFRAIVARHRPSKPAEAYLRLRTLPGEQAQVDWAHFDHVQIGQAKRRLLAFVMVLSWSRRVFLRFYLGDAMPNFLRGHVDALEFFGGVPRDLLYDNLKSAVIERVGDAIHFNETILALAGHYRFLPKPVGVARGNEKGRVERSIQYIRHSFFAAREWKDLDDLNAQALDWCVGLSSDRRCPGDRALTVHEAYAQEKPTLIALPDNPYPAEEREEVKVPKTPYVRFDLNDYSVPHTLVRKTLVVSATLATVRVLDGLNVVATHPRSFDRGLQIEDPAHVAKLVEYKRQASKHRGMDRLHHAVPSTQTLLREVAQRGGNLGSTVGVLLKLLDAYSAAALEKAVAEAVAGGAAHLSGVRHALDRHRQELGQAPPLPVHLPNDPRVQDLVVTPHSLDFYDTLHDYKESDQ